MTKQAHYWFPAKRRGWGWGLPDTWQGWSVLALFFLFLTGGALWLLPAYGSQAFIIFALLLSGVFVGICWAKGEPPSWR